MKVIELLNRIANKEELPKKIRFNNIEWNRVYGEKNVCYTDEYDSDFFLYFFRKNLDFTLNDEVEIIEKYKKIERITKKAFLNTPFGELVGGKFNEIIDAINEMREDK